MTRVKVGSIYTDTASLLLVDPCRVLRREEGDKTPDYDELMAVAFPTESGELADEWAKLLDKSVVAELSDEEKDRLMAIRHLSREAPPKIRPFADGLYVRCDNDGWYHVFIETDGDENVRLVIDLEARMER